MGAVATEECHFNEPVLIKIFYVDLSSFINYPFTVKYFAAGKLIAKYTIFKI